jgi:hypothetical protein
MPDHTSADTNTHGTSTHTGDPDQPYSDSDSECGSSTDGGNGLADLIAHLIAEHTDPFDHITNLAQGHHRSSQAVPLRYPAPRSTPLHGTGTVPRPRPPASRRTPLPSPHGHHSLPKTETAPTHTAPTSNHPHLVPILHNATQRAGSDAPRSLHLPPARTHVAAYHRALSKLGLLTETWEDEAQEREEWSKAVWDGGHHYYMEHWRENVQIAAA